jgi:hypothetical protein
MEQRSGNTEDENLEVRNLDRVLVNYAPSEQEGRRKLDAEGPSYTYEPTLKPFGKYTKEKRDYETIDVMGGSSIPGLGFVSYPQ